MPCLIREMELDKKHPSQDEPSEMAQSFDSTCESNLPPLLKVDLTVVHSDKVWGALEWHITFMLIYLL